MSWKENTHPLHSRAEYVIYLDLKKAGLRSLMMDKVVKLRKTLDEETTEFPTYPDFYFRGPDHVEWLIYLDGPPHLKRNVERRDIEVKKTAEEQGFHVLRYPYTTPLKDSRRLEIVTDILRHIRPGLRHMRVGRKPKPANATIKLPAAEHKRNFPLCPLGKTSS